MGGPNSVSAQPDTLFVHDSALYEKCLAQRLSISLYTNEVRLNDFCPRNLCPEPDLGYKPDSSRYIVLVRDFAHVAC